MRTKDKLKVSTDKNVDIAQLNSLFGLIGWKVRKKEKWVEVLSKSSFVYSIWDYNKLVGFGRVMEDGVMCMFYDIGVAPSYQGRGLGKDILNALIDQVKNKGYASIGLFAWGDNPSNIPFYEKFGFRRVGTGMELEKFMIRE